MSTTDKIQFHGWTDLIVPTESLFKLSSRAFKLYGYLIFRQRSNDGCFPGIERISSDLTTEEENWSEPTVKRYMRELVKAHYIYRQRRIGSSSITHVFKEPEQCIAFIRQITSDTTVSSPVIQQLDHPVSEIKNTQKKENTVEDSPPTAERATPEDEKQSPPSKKKKRDLLFEAVLLGSFNVTYTPGSKLPTTTAGRVNKICGTLRQMDTPPTGEEMARYYADYRSENPDLATIRGADNLVLSVTAWRQKAKPKPSKKLKPGLGEDGVRRLYDPAALGMG
jgi:hypothetical protein